MAMTTLHFPPEAEAAIARGQLIEAIRIVRAANGLDLKSAKEAVEAHVARRGGAVPSSQPATPPAHAPGVPSLEFPRAASDALARGDLIAAIKLLREANGHLGLKEAKDALDALRPAPKPGAHPRNMPTVMHGDGGLGGWALLAAVVVAAIAWWLLSL